MAANASYKYALQADTAHVYCGARAKCPGMSDIKFSQVQTQEERPAGSLLQEDWLTLSSSAGAAAAASASSGLPCPVEDRLESAAAVRGELASPLRSLWGLALPWAGLGALTAFGLCAAGDAVCELSAAAGLSLCLCVGESVPAAAVWPVLQAGALRASKFPL